MLQMNTTCKQKFIAFLIAHLAETFMYEISLAKLFFFFIACSFDVVKKITVSCQHANNNQKKPCLHLQ
jgi:hypothetical protein